MIKSEIDYVERCLSETEMTTAEISLYLLLSRISDVIVEPFSAERIHKRYIAEIEDYRRRRDDKS